jgi:redox-sensitive bicupin YhaK (pirin superfamily)
LESRAERQAGSSAPFYSSHVSVGPTPELLLLEPREVPLGGARAITVRRTLPHRDVRTIGPWCFVDHYGPHTGTGMDVGPHPHSGLQTVSWLLSGDIEHRDSLGSLALIHPGELNLMTAGRGIAHSEVCPPSATALHGVQLWVALPDAHRHQAPHFEQHTNLPRWDSAGVAVTVIIGELGGQRSPAAAYSPIVGAHLRMDRRASTVLALEPAYEHAVLLLAGSASVLGVRLGVGSLLSVGGGRRELEIGSDQGAQMLLLGGEPFAEELLMWWNFVGRSHDEIVADRADWSAGKRFGEVSGYPGERLPAPALPTTVLRPRPRRRR